MLSAIRQLRLPQGSSARRLLAIVLLVAGIVVAVWGQHVLLSEPDFGLRGPLLMTVGGLAFLAALVIGWQALDARAALDDEAEESAETSFRWELRQAIGLSVGVLGGLAGFLLNDNNTFTTWGFLLWVVGSLAIVLAFWPRQFPSRFRLPKLRASSAWSLAALAVTLVIAAVLRLFDLENLPREMVGDHAEDIYDIRRVSDGAHPVYFTAAKGREGLCFYLAAALAPFFGYSFLTIKVLTAITGVVTVAATYFMTKELFGNRRVALIAAVLISLSFWHIIYSRLGFRPIFAPLPVALTLLFLFRALKYNRTSDFVFAGLFLGLGLYTYTAVRALPLAIGLILIFGLLTRLFAGRREWPTFLINAGLLVLTTLIVFAPMGRYAVDEPDMYWKRTLERTEGGSEDGLSVLASNTRRTLLMFNWEGHKAGIFNAPDSAQLDYVSGAAFVLGLGGMALFWLRRRKGLNAYAALTLFVMLIPGIGTQFAGEVPSAFRTAGAIPLVFAAAALPFYMGSEFLVRAFGKGAVLLVLTLLGVSFGLIGFVNRDIYFDDYADFNTYNSRNTTEYAAVIRQFEERGGELDNAYLKTQPGGINIRVLAVEIGDLDWSNAFGDIEEASEHVLNPKEKLFLISVGDEPSLQRLQQIYRQGSAYVFDSVRSAPGKPTKDLSFFVFLVPAQGETEVTPLPDTRPLR